MEEQSHGFSPEAEFTSLPVAFFTRVMPKVHNLAELKMTLYILHLLQCKQLQCLHTPREVKGSSAEGSAHKPEAADFVTYKELSSFGPLINGMEKGMLRGALSLAEKDGIIVRAILDIDGQPEEVYSINSESELKAMSKNGKHPVSKVPLQENIFSLYEQNIGIITPMLAEELKEAEKLYPEQWIKQAFKEAVIMNKRSWKYIARILERWASEGKEGGEHRKNTKEGGPDKYIKGKYGHLVKR